MEAIRFSFFLMIWNAIERYSILLSSTEDIDKYCKQAKINHKNATD